MNGKGTDSIRFGFLVQGNREQHIRAFGLGIRLPFVIFPPLKIRIGEINTAETVRPG
ncbi:hypothetical protein D3C87_1786960 [compost metagenome]